MKKVLLRFLSLLAFCLALVEFLRIINTNSSMLGAFPAVNLAYAASGPIVIYSNGTITPSTPSIQLVEGVFTLTADITFYDDGIGFGGNYTIGPYSTLDGAGHTIQGLGSGDKEGLFVMGNGLTVRNMQIKSFGSHGVHVAGYDMVVTSCTITGNGGHGVYLDAGMIDGGGHTVSGNSITGNVMDGIYAATPATTITGNTISNHDGDSGIAIFDSLNTITENIITDNWYGIELQSVSPSSPGNTIVGNTLKDNNCGLYLHENSNNYISGNVIASNSDGINLAVFSDACDIVANNITDNSRNGIVIGYGSDSNKFYYNNILNNNLQVKIDEGAGANTWDDGYPNGGNHWSNYTGTDVKKGPNQDEDGSDGIGDSWHTINANNIDHYPLMTAYIIPEFSSTLIMPLYITATLLAAIIIKRKRSRCRAIP